MEYIASWSGGKDSTASIILAHENKEPLDLIVFSEVMFDENISGEIPEQVDFIYNVAKPMFESWGYEVKILRTNKTYMDCFTQVQKRSKEHPERIGKIRGFPMAGRCKINSDIKVKAIKDFFKNLNENEYKQYVGIAIDEPKRLERLKGTNRISLLEKYNYTEEMAKQLCEKYNLLSPVYKFTKRGGCWFCPNMRENEKRHLYNNHKELWKKLLDLEDMPNKVGTIFNILTKESMHDIDKQFKIEDSQMTIFDIIGE